MNKVLIVIDAQEDFTRGALRNEQAIAALPIIKDIVDYADKNFDIPVHYTMDTHHNNYMMTQEGKNLPVPHCEEYTPGWELCPEVLPTDSRSEIVVFKKPSFGYQYWNRYQNIEDADEIWLCGFCTDICVSANFQILKAAYPETPIVVIEDACAGVTPELHEAALKVMKSCQADIVKWEDIKGVR